MLKALLSLDLTLGINPVALVLLGHLAKKRGLDDGATISTRAWYNGRECGVSLEVGEYGQEHLFVTFGECRHSDMIFVDHWISHPTMNGPSTHFDSDKRDMAYAARERFEPESYSIASEFIYTIVRDWVSSRATFTTKQSIMIPRNRGMVGQ